MKKSLNNIKIIDIKLCTGCGTCSALCPNDAIQITLEKKKGIYLPELKDERCNNCGICLRVCPNHDVDLEDICLKIFGKKPDNIIIGNYLNCYIGYSNNYNIRYNSASGGLVTQLLISALEEGIIDGALITRMKNNKPLEPEPFIARTKEEIIEARGSKYCPVPLNITLKEIIKNAGKGEKFAIVGLPCHIRGLRKAQIVNAALRERVVLCVGIMCSHTVNFLGTEFLLKKLGIRKEDVRKLDYRGEGWPGSMKIWLKNDKFLLISLPDYWGNLFGLYFFTPTSCLLCSDGICELADISCGDAWLQELSDDKIGSSVIVSKSSQGDRLLQMMNSKNKINLIKVDARKVIQSQLCMLYLKKKQSKAFCELFNTVPENQNIIEPDTIDRFIALFPYLNAYMSSNSVLTEIIISIPTKLTRLYGVPYSLISTRKAKKYFEKLF